MGTVGPVGEENSWILKGTVSLVQDVGKGAGGGDGGGKTGGERDGEASRAGGTGTKGGGGKGGIAG